MKNTYWNHNGKYQALANSLEKLIPAMGEVSGKENKALERFRKACNLYYRLYNDGDYTIGFRAMFKTQSRNSYEKIDMRMDEIILAAAAEQLGNK